MILTYDHPIEWIWLMTAAVDVWVSLSSWRAAHQDWRRAKRERDALDPAVPRVGRVSRDAVTYAIEVSACLNAILAILLFVAASVSLFLPPPPPDYTAARQSLWIVLVLIGVSGLNAVIAIYGRLVRYRLSSGYFERQEASRAAGRTAAKAIVDAYTTPPERKD